MIGRPRTSRDWRTLLWAAAALLCPLVYWLRTEPFPRYTPVGVEHRLFGMEAVPTLDRSPGGRWIAALTQPAPVSLTFQVLDPSSWLSQTQHYLDLFRASPQGARPPLAIISTDGTWRLEGGRLRYLWRLPGNWVNNRYLSAENPLLSGGPLGTQLLDAGTGRVFKGEAAARLITKLAPPAADYDSWGDSFEPAPISPALEDLPAGFDETGSRQLPNGEATLLWAGDNDVSSDLFAASSDEAQRYLKLADRAAPLATSPDGRTIYLYRKSGLWRLDLRKPVAELLKEIEVPVLPLDSVLER